MRLGTNFVAVRSGVRMAVRTVNRITGGGWAGALMRHLDDNHTSVPAGCCGGHIQRPTMLSSSPFTILATA